MCVGRGYRGEAPTWTITATSNSALGGTVTCTPNPVAHGGSSTCTATSNSGYAFIRWSGDCAGTAGPTCTLNHISSAKTVTANLIELNLALPHRGGWRAILGR